MMLIVVTGCEGSATTRMTSLLGMLSGVSVALLKPHHALASTWPSRALYRDAQAQDAARRVERETRLLWGWAPGPTSRLAPDSAAEIANFTAERWSTSEWPFESLANRSDDLFGGTAAREGVAGACAPAPRFVEPPARRSIDQMGRLGIALAALVARAAALDRAAPRAVVVHRSSPFEGRGAPILADLAGVAAAAASAHRGLDAARAAARAAVGGGGALNTSAPPWAAAAVVLVRDPPSAVASQVRRCFNRLHHTSRNALASTLVHLRYLERALGGAAAPASTPVVPVAFDALAARPRDAVARVAAALGLDAESARGTCEVDACGDARAGDCDMPAARAARAASAVLWEECSRHFPRVKRMLDAEVTSEVPKARDRRRGR